MSFLTALRAKAERKIAERLDGATIRVGSILEGPREGEVVLESEVDHAIRRSGSSAQAVEVIESAEMHLCPGRS